MEAAEEAQKNGWGAWLLSPIYKKIEDTEEEKADKERRRQERKIERDMKERRRDSKTAELKKQEDLLRNARLKVDTADMDDDVKIQSLKYKIQEREDRERWAREMAQREERAKRQRQENEEREKREKRERELAAAKAAQAREARAARAKQHAEEEAARLKRNEEEARKFSKKFHDHYNFSHPTTRRTKPYTTSEAYCRHDGWWAKIEGRAPCPTCHDVWTYLLECPGCEMKACPKCQRDIRPRRQQRTARPQVNSRFDDDD